MSDQESLPGRLRALDPDYSAACQLGLEHRRDVEAFEVRVPLVDHRREAADLPVERNGPRPSVFVALHQRVRRGRVVPAVCSSPASNQGQRGGAPVRLASFVPGHESVAACGVQDPRSSEFAMRTVGGLAADAPTGLRLLGRAGGGALVHTHADGFGGSDQDALEL